MIAGSGHLQPDRDDGRGDRQEHEAHERALGVGLHARDPCRRQSVECRVRGAQDGVGTVVADGALAHPVHHVGHRHPGVDVVDHQRAAPATPVADVLVRARSGSSASSARSRRRTSRRCRAPGRARRPARRRSARSSPSTAARRRAPSRRRTPATGPAPRCGRCRGRRPRGSPPGATGSSTTPRPRGGGWRRGTGSSRGRPPPSRRRCRTAAAGRGITEGDAVVALGRRADVEVGAERPGDLLGEERADRAAVDPADHLADQVALADAVVARTSSPAPTTSPARRADRRPCPSRTGRSVEMRCSHAGRPAVCESRWRTSTLPLPLAANSGQYRSTGRVDVDEAAAGQHEQRQAAHRLRRREDVDDRVPLPRRRARLVGVPPHRSTTSSPPIVTATDAPTSPLSVKLRGERVLDRAEAFGAVAVDVDHARCSSQVLGGGSMSMCRRMNRHCPSTLRNWSRYTPVVPTTPRPMLNASR